MTLRPPAALLASTAVHAGLLLLLLVLPGPGAPEVEQRRVRLQFDAAPRPLPPPAARPAARERELPPAALADSLGLQGPRTLSLPGGSQRLPDPAAPAGTSRVAGLLPPPPAEVPAVPGAARPPSVQQVLSELPSLGPPAAAPGGASERGFLEAPALEWGGRGRTLLTAGSLGFPEILLREGREADVEAEFTVAPSGQVVAVEILRSSGYAAVDREVEKALYGYLFEPAPEGGEDVGRVRFRFRLERDQ